MERSNVVLEGLDESGKVGVGVGRSRIVHGWYCKVKNSPEKLGFVWEGLD